MTAYYNEIDPFAADCLEELIEKGLIANGIVDRRSIKQVAAEDLAGFEQVHLFAGIGGWSLALRIAGWPDERPAWTGSCPCQPFSVAGKGKGKRDSRHLWPWMRHLMFLCRPTVAFGEQVASKDGREWLAGVRANLETISYVFGAADLCAASVGLPHVRQRLWWFANSSMYGLQGIQRGPETQIQKDRASEALASRDCSRNPFSNWKKFLAESDVRRVDDGVSSTVDIRPRLHAYGNAIVPQVAAEFIRAFMDVQG